MLMRRLILYWNPGLLWKIGALVIQEITTLLSEWSLEFKMSNFFRLAARCGVCENTDGAGKIAAL